MSVRRPVTLADVAKIAGVAKSTASYAFSDPSKVSPGTTQRVLDAARELGYTGPSALGRALASGRTSVVAVVTRALLETSDTDPFALRVVDGISRELASLGYGVLLLPPITDAGTRTLHAGAIYDAAITVRRIDGIEETDAMLAQREVPWLRLDGTPDEERALTIDAVAPSAQLLRALLDWGHVRIATVTLHPALEHSGPAFLDGPAAKALMDSLPASVPQRVTRDRLEAFARVGIAPSQIATCPVVTKEYAYAAALRLLSLPTAIRPTAIVCQADVFAWGVVVAAKELGLRVPEDVSVTGFDGLTEGVFAHLDLTSVVQDGTQKGRLIARWIVLACNGTEVPPPFDLPLSVRWGSSAGPAPQS